MKSRNRELNIFSMSALDLFASAMGAFILIAFVLFPYFPNTDDSAEKARLEQEKARLEQEKARLEQEKARLQQENARLEQTADNTPILEQEKARLEQEKARLQQENARLEQDIDNTSVLLGIKTIAKKFVIVVDMSGSIREYRDFVKLSIQDMLSSFRTEIELVMIGFHGSQLHYWPENRQYFQVGRNTRNPVMATINTWMGQVGGGTPTREALLEALALNPEEIILLSDGAPAGEWRDVVRTITESK